MEFMHLSMVCPGMGGGGGRATHGKCHIFRFSMSMFPPLDLHLMSNCHTWGPETLHSTLNEMIGTYKKCIQYGGRAKFPTLGTVVDVKIPTHVRFTKSNSRGLPAAPLPILGQSIDRCIKQPRRLRQIKRHLKTNICAMMTI